MGGATSNVAGVSRAGMHLPTVSRAQFARENLVYNLGQIRNGYVKDFIRRRFVCDSLKEGGALMEDGWPRLSSEACFGVRIKVWNPWRAKKKPPSAC